VDVRQISPIMSAGDLERIAEKARTEGTLLITLITPMVPQGDAARMTFAYQSAEIGDLA